MWYAPQFSPSKFGHLSATVMPEGAALLLAACGLRLPAAAAGLKPAAQASQLCTEEPRRAEPGGALETCAQGFERGVPCRTLYRTHSCCTRCDPNHGPEPRTAARTTH